MLHRCEPCTPKVEPDKAAIAGYALLSLYKITKNLRYLDVALATARTLAATQNNGTNTTAPWPFRVDAETGMALDGRKNGNMAYALRLYRTLVELGYNQFTNPAARLWHWMSQVQLASLKVCQVL